MLIVSGQLDYYLIDHYFYKMKNLAKNLLSQAVENEPKITEDLQNIAEKISAEMVSLENRFKSEESLTRKMIDAAKINSQSYKDISDTINDVLRYTFILSFENYTDSFQKTIEMLWKVGYYIPEKRIWNAWKTAGKRFDKGYRGINITVISSQNQKFELQFHTEESFGLKTKTHFLYKKLRNKKFSRKHKSVIIGKLREFAKDVKRPKGI